MLWPLRRTLASSAKSGLTEGTRSRSGAPRKVAMLESKNCSAAAFAYSIKPVAPTTSTGSGSAAKICAASGPRWRGRRSGATALPGISGRLPVDLRAIEGPQQLANVFGLVLSIDFGAKFRRARQTLGVPGEVLAGHADAGLAAIVRQHRIVVLQHDLELTRERRVGLVGASPEKVDHLRGEPRPAIGAAPNHHAIGA